MRKLGLVSADGRPLEVRLIGYGDRTAAGNVHQAIAPLLELVAVGSRGRAQVLALVPVDFARERVSKGMHVGGGERPVLVPAQEVTRMLAWVDAGDVEDTPVVIVCGDELELRRVAAALGRLPVEVVRATRPAQAHAALARSPAAAVIAGTAPGLANFVRAARAADVPLIAVGDEDPSLAGVAGVTRMPALDEQRLVAAVSDLLDFV